VDSRHTKQNRRLDTTGNDDAGGRHPERSAELHPSVIFLTVTALTVVSLTLHVLLAMFGSDSQQIQAAAEATSTTYKMGFGAIVGLLGRRTR